MQHPNKYDWLPAFMLKSLFWIFLFPLSVSAQIDRNRKEEINITSAFKPSIVKSGKLEFRADPPVKDTSAYSFKYAKTPFKFTTSVGPIEVKPMAFQTDTIDNRYNGESYFAKLGYGSLQNPFAQLSYNSKSATGQFSMHLDHSSAKGELPDQQYLKSSLISKYDYFINKNQVAEFHAGYDFNAYKLYGFDHSIISLPPDQVNQNYHHAYGGIAYQHIAGSDGQILFTPTFRYDYIRTNRLISENQIVLRAPISFKISSGLYLKTALELLTVQLNDNANKIDLQPLLQLPVGLNYDFNEVSLSGAVRPVLKNGKFSVLPEFMVSYALPETGAKVKAGVHNSLNINSLNKLLQVNPFMRAIDTLTVFQEQQYFVGFDLHTAKGLQLSLKTGFSQFKNQILYYNDGVAGNELQPQNESSLASLMLEANLSYIFTNKFKFSSDLIGYSFQKQLDYDEAYGLLPLELKFRLDWEPIERLKTRFSTVLWSGTMSKTSANTDVKLPDGADISFGVEYNLNKKWAIWIDLNNIANTRYQRWNQYPSFGFNFMGGVRYVFNKKH